jgi:hypothetical protein
LPETLRTDDVRAAFAASFDDCAAGLVLADMMGLDATGGPMASR